MSKELFQEPPHKAPTTISEMADNNLTDIFNRAQAGEITWVEAKEQMDKLEAMRAAAGDGWFDRYGPPSPELEDLLGDDQR